MNRSMDALRLGLLSTADINRKLLAGAAESDDVEVVAVGSRDLPRAEAYAPRSGIARAYGTYDELLADAEVDAVYIPLPNTMHHEWSIRALEAGKHVLCEKPFSRHAREVERGLRRRRRRRARAVGGVHVPAPPADRASCASSWRRARSAAAGGPVDVQLLALRRRQHPRCCTDARRRRADGRRLLLRQRHPAARGRAGARRRGAGHRLDRHRHGVPRDAALPGRRLGAVRLRRFARRTATSSRRRRGGVLTVSATFPWTGASPCCSRGADGERSARPRRRGSAANSYRLELENLADAIAARAPQLLGREDALGQARAIEALYRSADEGRTVGRRLNPGYARSCVDNRDP